jgi:hypothetical protein
MSEFEGHRLMDQLLDSTVETVGYVDRVLGHFDGEAKTPFIIQSLLILLVPALFAATIYIILEGVI